MQLDRVTRLASKNQVDAMIRCNSKLPLTICCELSVPFCAKFHSCCFTAMHQRCSLMLLYYSQTGTVCNACTALAECVHAGLCQAKRDLEKARG